MAMSSTARDTYDLIVADGHLDPASVKYLKKSRKLAQEKTKKEPEMI